MIRPLVTVAATAIASLLIVAGPVPATSGTSAVKVVRWSDGDTVVTTAGAVRLIGIDTPEIGQCGYAKASRRARALAPVGSVVQLINPRSMPERDGYGRLLRYVMAGNVDVGMRQVRNGAKARYDGYDGGSRHPRQAKYRRVDRQHPNYCEGGTDLKSYPPISDLTCPRHAPIKGNVQTSDPTWREPYKGIYHLPGQEFYVITSPEECFATEAGAARAGYRGAYT